MLPQLPRRVSVPTPLAVGLVVALVLAVGGVGVAAGQITSAQIRNNTVKGKDVKDSSLTGKDIANGSVGSSELTLQKGETVRGGYAASGEADSSWVAVSLPVLAPTQIDSAHVVVVGYDLPVPAAGCTGTLAAPAAAPGYVCVYPSLVTGTSFIYGWGLLCACTDPGTSASATGDGTRFGFLLQSVGSASSHASKGSWAYTAP